MHILVSYDCTSAIVAVGPPNHDLFLIVFLIVGEFLVVFFFLVKYWLDLIHMEYNVPSPWEDECSKGLYEGTIDSTSNLS